MKTCPKCGFQTEKNATECMRCGIVFAKFEFLQPIGKKETLFQSKVLLFEQGELSTRLRPFVVAKEYVETVYAKILESIWTELVKGENRLGGLDTVIAFVLFSLFSMLFYRLGEFDGLVILCAAAIWFGDNRAAKRAYEKAARYESILISRGTEKEYVYERRDPNGRPLYDMDFLGTEIKKIAILRKSVRGGAFMEVLDDVWRVSLVFQNNFELLAFEEKTIAKAVVRAQLLRGRFRVPVEFVGALNERFLKNERKEDWEKGLSVSRNDHGTEIRTKWNFQVFSRFAMNVMNRSGFLLFLLAMQGVMIRFGMLVDHYVAPYLGLDPARLEIDLSFGGMLSVFVPDLGPLDTVEYGLALALLVRSGMVLAKSREIAIDNKRIQYKVNKKIDSAMQTSDVKGVLLYEDPEPLVLVLGRKRVIEIDDLRDPDEYKAVYFGIKEGVEKAGGNRLTVS